MESEVPGGGGDTFTLHFDISPRKSITVDHNHTYDHISDSAQPRDSKENTDIKYLLIIFIK